ncbi:MAG: A/G-specific adenine glycosylase [Pseudobacteriovorax sp.]|nr:A/G-specific adenine glycosylase [Pseudobacteriovorax sp.]
MTSHRTATEAQPIPSIHFNLDELGARISQWYDSHQRELPWRRKWRETQDPYVVWVSEIMLQQTVIKAVIPAYARFLETFPNVQSLAAASEEEVRLASRGLGYYRRFNFLHRAAQVLTQASNIIDWPTSYKDWLKLPGVGQYTAAAIASICFEEPVAVVDGNVERVFCRLFDIQEEPNQPRLKKAFFEIGNKAIAKQPPGSFNQGIMELGQTHCSKGQTECQHCPLSSLCLANKRGTQKLAPKLKKRQAPIEVSMEVIIPINKENKIGLEERPKNAKFLGGTWGFPTKLVNVDGEKSWDGTRPSSFESHQNERIGAIKHSITKHKIQSDVYVSKRYRNKTIKWFDQGSVEENLVSNLDRKALRKYQNSAILN